MNGLTLTSLSIVISGPPRRLVGHELKELCLEMNKVSYCIVGNFCLCENAVFTLEVSTVFITSRPVLRLVCGFRVCIYICASALIPVRNNCVTYIVAM